MDPLTMAAIGAGLGYLKGEFVDRPRENRDRQVAAVTQRFSPWTGMQAGPIRQADSFGSALQGGMTGATLGQGLQAQEAYKAELAKKAAAASAGTAASAVANPALTAGMPQFTQATSPEATRQLMGYRPGQMNWNVLNPYGL